MNSMSPSLFSHNLRPMTLTASACSSKPELASKNGNTNNIVSFLVRAWPVVGIPRMSFSIQAKKRSSEPESVPKKNIVEEVDMDDDEDYEDDDDFQDEEFLDDDELLEDEYEDDDAELNLGDGAAGGGIKLAGTTWDKEALAIAEDVSFSLGDLKIYAFKTLINNFIQVRIEKLSNKSGSPSMTDIEAFSSAYRERLNEAELAGRIPENISFEVSSPGVERVVGIPQDLDRFKDRPMYVKYVCDEPSTSSPAESDGIFRLVSFDLDTRCCTWGIADVKVNREKAGKGRPLNKKQRDWRLNTSFESLLLVRLYSEC